MKQVNFNRISVLSITLLISILFIFMIKGFLMAIFLAAIFAGVTYPAYRKIRNWVKGRTSLASLLTLLVVIFIILLPISGILLIVIDQAIEMGNTVGPDLRKILQDPSFIISDLESIPIFNRIFPDEQSFINTIEDVIKSLGNFIISELSDFSAGTANFILNLFIFLFTLYYFFIHGPEYLRKFLLYLPLKNEEEELLLSRFTRVTKATLKGTFLIAIIQGTIGGIGLAITGIPNVLFWSLIMAVFSIIPALGPALIWIPASVFLFLQGQILYSIILVLIGAVVIGNIDNFLRPKLVGRDTKMPDLMILFGTLGGLAIFGMAGIIVGPIVAALFMSIWDIYGETFKEFLYPVKGV